MFSKTYLNIRNLLHLFGVNRAVFFGVLSKVWFAAAGALTVFLIVAYFSPEIQGYYFTFCSLLSLQILVELGLNTVIISFASHEWSSLELDENKRITGSMEALSRLRSIARGAFRWYTSGAIVLLIGLGSIGYVFFISSGQAGVNWILPWFSLCAAASLNLCFLPAFSLLEGCNQVSQVYFYRFIQEVVRSTSAWIIIILGGGLWALAGSTIFIIIWTLIYLTKNYYSFFKILLLPEYEQKLNWKKEIWPMQWKLAVGWLSSYFCFYIFTPILFYYKGAVAAGQMGITWSMSNALLLIASMWIVTRMPQFGVLIARKEYKELDRILLRSAIMSVLVASCGAIVLFCFIMLLNMFYPTFAVRFLSPFPTALFLLAVIFMQISIAQSTYLRAHKREPFMLISIIFAVLTTLMVLVAVNRWGAAGIALSYLSIVVIFVIPSGTFIWFRCRKIWHADDITTTDILPDERAII
jgi:O-antigen/teichoic acid export membrane protein